MTHTLHRTGKIKSLEKDYVIMSMAGQKINDQGAKVKIRQTLKIMAKYNPVNLSGEIGGIYTGHTIEEIIENLTDQSYASAVFTDEFTLDKLLSDLKEADLGLSVVVSGPFHKVFEVANRVGLKPHTVNMSLGVFGPPDLLADKNILDITTMCGHDMVNSRRTEKILKKVVKGNLTPEKAAKALAKSCTCGVFNVQRTANIIENISTTRKIQSGDNNANQ